MKHEFNSRVAAQRQILRVVNDKGWNTENLFGLSTKAIDRWVSVNQIDPNSKLVQLVKYVSGKLFFLANKSQEQISEEYLSVSHEVSDVCHTLSLEISKMLIGNIHGHSRGTLLIDRVRGRGDIAMTTDEIMALTRDD